MDNDKFDGQKRWNAEENIKHQVNKQWALVWIFKKIVETYRIIEAAKADPSVKELIEDYSNSLLHNAYL